MSRNSKNARNMARARAITLLHKKGEKGPARTAAKHDKRWTYRGNADAMKRLDEVRAGGSPSDGRTGGKRRSARG